MMDEGLVVVELEMGQGLWGMRVLSVKAGVEQRVVVEKDQAAEGQLAEGLDGQGGGEVVCLRAQPWPLASVKSRVTVRVSADNHSSHPFFSFFLRRREIYMTSQPAICISSPQPSRSADSSVPEHPPSSPAQSPTGPHRTPSNRPHPTTRTALSDAATADSSFSMQGAKAQGDAAWNR